MNHSEAVLYCGYTSGSSGTVSPRAHQETGEVPMASCTSLDIFLSLLPDQLLVSSPGCGLHTPLPSPPSSPSPCSPMPFPPFSPTNEESCFDYSVNASSGSVTPDCAGLNTPPFPSSPSPPFSPIPFPSLSFLSNNTCFAVSPLSSSGSFTPDRGMHTPSSSPLGCNTCFACSAAAVFPDIVRGCETHPPPVPPPSPPPVPVVLLQRLLGHPR